MKRVVSIKWLDAHGDGGGWMTKKKIDPDAAACYTYGVLHKETKKYMCVIQTDGMDGQYYNHMCIPKSMIVKVKTLK